MTRQKAILVSLSENNFEMKIAIIGSGNVGGTLALKWANKGHQIFIGTRDQNNFKGQDLLENGNIRAQSIPEAVRSAEVILMAVPATMTVEVTKSLGDTSGKLIIDSMNMINGRGPKGYQNTADAILDHTATDDLAKCFNTTGFNNMKNPKYGNLSLDLFTCGDSKTAKKAAVELARDAGFENCYDIGGNDKFSLMEEFAWFWINLAMVQGQGREIGFKLLKRG